MTTPSFILPPYATRPPHGPLAEKMARTVANGLPKALVGLWAAKKRGVLIIDAEQAPRFENGPFYWRDVQANGAIYLPVDCDAQALWQQVGIWLDYFAGSFGQQSRLSEGVGATDSLLDAATRFQKIAELGYANDFLHTTDPSQLFVRAIVAYQLARRDLNTADPLLTRWLRNTIFNEAFWKKVIPQTPALTPPTPLSRV